MRDAASGDGGRRPARHRPTPGDLGVLLVVGAAYYLGARLGLGLSLVEHNVTPLWPPTGIAVAAFVLLDRRRWAAVTVAVGLAALAVNLPISTGPLAAAVTAMGNAAAPLVAALLLRRVGFRRQLDRLRDALAIVLLGALASMTVSATVGAFTLVASGAIPMSELPTAWAVWWTGDAMGVLVVTPFLLALPLIADGTWGPRQWLEGVAVLVATGLVSAWAAFSTMAVLVLVLPVLGWAAWRLQLRGAAPAALVASVVTTSAATHQSGPFEGLTLLEQMVSLQAFNACVALTSFFLASLVSERLDAAAALARWAGELEERVEQRTADLSAANERLRREIRSRSRAQQQLSHEEARAEREHEIAGVLQRSMLPGRLPDLPGIAVAARYVPATTDVQVGGDWYDVIPLAHGQVGLVIGDVAGHGVRAAATMGQVRMAVRAYAVQDPSPVRVLRRVHRLLARLTSDEMVTLVYLLADPAAGTVRLSSAGHPPPLLVHAGAVRQLDGALSPPLGVTLDRSYTEVVHALPPDATLLLYTDGLVERRGVAITDGLDRLAASAVRLVKEDGGDLGALCDALLLDVLGDADRSDDVALVAVRATPAHEGRPSPDEPTDDEPVTTEPVASGSLAQARSKTATPRGTRPGPGPADLD
ncbi:PP2C family protein-serine/threonine phosphatase [Intrasporangium sp. YIM S08009]|uniref:PP2C family protein-serine/threonine phosphatase n=1 Tax=Intrasporangium zincisolvens TaxID=3080018 RepID=UPI002B059C41|nr:SpoIIE family protein phosphatase [Intrasporangium sp. YIM S08009]